MDMTQHYNLKKPSPVDNYDIQDHNTNMEVIDNALKVNADAVSAHVAETISSGTHGLDETIAKCKNGTGVYTTRGTAHIVTDPFCTANSFPIVQITGAELPRGKWQAESQDGQFIITSTKEEISDIPFNYFLIKAVG